METGSAGEYLFCQLPATPMLIFLNGNRLVKSELRISGVLIPFIADIFLEA
jgi:hypothetical protein